MGLHREERGKREKKLTTTTSAEAWYEHALKGGGKEKKKGKKKSPFPLPKNSPGRARARRRGRGKKEKKNIQGPAAMPAASLPFREGGEKKGENKC